MSRRYMRWTDAVGAAVRHAVGNRYRAAGTVTVAAVTYVLFILSTFPTYSIQLLDANVLYLGEAVGTLTWNFTETAGVHGLGLVTVYAVLTGVAVVNMVTLVQRNGMRSMVAGSGSITPAFLVGGCAGCGAGLLGAIGFIGALSLLPFNGNGVRLLGIILILVFLVKTGDPKTCTI